MPRRAGLGRGLEALIPSEEVPTPGNVSNVPVDRIVPNPRQPRERFEDQALAELADSIRQHGVLQPLILTLDEQSGKYTLVAGERRLLAARQAGLQTVPAIVRQVSDQERLELALIENLQRADLNPLEAAEAYRQLNEDFGLPHEEIAAQVGKSRASITNTLRLLKLTPAGRQALMENYITEGHARALLALPTPQAQNNALQVVLARELSVRHTEELVRSLSGHKPPPTPRSTAPPEVSALEERLRSHLGTKVNLKRRRKGGTLVIHYYSDEELNALVETILGRSQDPSDS